MNAESIRIECDEDGFHLILELDEEIVEGDEGRLNVRLSDPEELYDRVKAEIGPWLRERDMAASERIVAVREDGSYRVEPDDDRAYDLAKESGYEPTDPKHPTYHERMSALYDCREGK